MADLEKLDKTISDLEVQSKSLADFNQVFADMAKLKEDVKSNLDVLRENNQGFEHLAEVVKGKLEESKGQIQEIYQDNKAFQKELDQSLTTRLDKHKSDLEVSIRNEGAQIQRGFETALRSEFTAMNTSLSKSFEAQRDKVNTLKTLLIVILIITIVLAGVLGFLLLR